MKIFLFFFFTLAAIPVQGASSMRRCSLLPVTDSVGGAIGFKVFEKVEDGLKKSNWCTYVSNSSLISVFSRYRENLPQYLKTPEVLATVSEKLRVGSLILVTLKNELDGIEAAVTVYGDNGEDVYFSEKALLPSDEIDVITKAIKNWLDVYSRTIPYDAKINGILGEQITLDVGKGYPIQEGQEFIVKRPVAKKKHPLLKKIVDWETEVLAEGKVLSISDNQALGIVKIHKSEKKLATGDWVRLKDVSTSVSAVPMLNDKDSDDAPGSLGILSVALFGSNTNVNTTTPGGSRQVSGNLYGINFRVEGWITRQYFGALEVERSLGTLKESSGDADKSSVNANNGVFKLTGGYKYLPIGFFYGPQIDLFAGYVNYAHDLDFSRSDGFGANNISGLLLGTAANIPINREYRFFAGAEFIPFPSYSEDDEVFGDASTVSALEFEIGMRYYYTPRMTVDGSLEMHSRKAKFDGDFKEISYKDNRLKIGVSFNF